MLRKTLWLFLLVIIVVVYFLGPQPPTPHYQKTLPDVDIPLERLDSYVDSTENLLPLRENNNATIVWADSMGRKTEYVILYLPGFSATRMEGNPVHRNIAREFHANLYLARLDFHGFKENQLEGFTAEAYWNSALEQFAIASKLGKKVIIMATSTGATLGLNLAASFPDEVSGLICLSPNIRVNNAASFLLNNPWGLYLARMVFGGPSRHIHHKQEEAKLYWDTLYPAEAVVQLQELLETTMTDSTFNLVHCPVLTLYYYKDKNHQDEVVDASQIPLMHQSLGTADSLKVIKALPTPGDHVIASYIKSKDYKSVEIEISKFLSQTMRLQKNQVQQNSYSRSD